MNFNVQFFACLQFMFTSDQLLMHVDFKEYFIEVSLNLNNFNMNVAVFFHSEHKYHPCKGELFKV